MNMTLSEMEAAVSEAKATLRRADAMVPQMLHLIKGRLRTINGWHDLNALAELKRELRDFNPQRKIWKK